MALARCEKHGQPQGKKKPYLVAVNPIGYPNETALVCGIPACEEPARVWLIDVEKADFERGRTIFGFATNVTKVRVEPFSG